jgi:protein-S-isoprenylcysteine O-methyltransferase Ste14
MERGDLQTSAPFSALQRGFALVYGGFSLVLFGCAVAVMMYALYGGLLTGYGGLTGLWRWGGNLLLIAQFPLLHSTLLSPAGRAVLSRIAPGPLGVRLQTTTYVVVASLQILAVFLLWSPAQQPLWNPQGFLWGVHIAVYSVAWVLLGKSMWDAHLGIQMGYLGWTSVWRNQVKIGWPGLPTSGLFRICRQPIYFSFMLTLWSGPVWSVDKVFLAVLWSAYCYWRPQLKERRLERSFGDLFRAYRARTPYWPGGGRRV